MPKPRTKREDLRAERKRKRQDECRDIPKKRPKHDEDGDGFEQEPAGGELEFFGMLSDEDQAIFRDFDKDLDDENMFPTPADRDVFVEGVFQHAKDMELKLACSQSCSRLMEKLIKLSTPKQKKRLFEAFAGHFLTLVQHRFASHCCEMLFLASAPIVSNEMGRRGEFKTDAKGIAAEEQKKAKQSTEQFSEFEIDVKGIAAADEETETEQAMEQLFLLTLDELEADLGFLLSNTFASHSLRVLLLVLAGRPFDFEKINYLIKSKGKKGVLVKSDKFDHGKSEKLDEMLQQERKVPPTFDMAVRKIISDTVATMDKSSLRVLVTHPVANPLLQLLLELDIKYGRKVQKNHKEDDEAAESGPVLLPRLLPGAPDSLKEDTSAATEFVLEMMYDQIGSRLIEALIERCPGKIFKALHQHIFAGRMASYVCNGIASYPALKVLGRLGRVDLVDYIGRILPVIPALMEKERYNVIKTLFERCTARQCDDEIGKLRTAVVEACGGDPKNLIPKVCHIRDAGDMDQQAPQYARQQSSAAIKHGVLLVTAMLQTPGPAAKAAQTSMLALSQDEVVQLATKSSFACAMFTTALERPSLNPLFHKSLVATILPRVAELAKNSNSNQIVKAIVEIPSHGKTRSIPFHLKEALMTSLAADTTLVDSDSGKYIWRSLKGVLWKTRRMDWINWAKEVDGDETARYAAAPISKEERGHQGRGHISKTSVNPTKTYAERRIRNKDKKRLREADALVTRVNNVEINDAEREVRNSQDVDMANVLIQQAGDSGTSQMASDKALGLNNGAATTDEKTKGETEAEKKKRKKEKRARKQMKKEKQV